MGLFDDLIPAEGGAQSTPPSGAGMFDDLIPQQPAPAQSAPRPQATINGATYERDEWGDVRRVGASPSDPPITDPAILDAVPQNPGPTTGDYLGEAGRSFARGGISTVGSMVKGAALLTAAPEEEVARIEQGIANIRAMPYEQAEAFRQSLRTMNLNPAAAIAYEAALRARYAGDDERADSYLADARSLAKPGKVSDSDLYQAGQSVQDRARADFPQNPDFRDSWTSGIGEGFGSTGALLATAPLGAAGVAAAGALATGSEGYDEAWRDIAESRRDDRAGLYNAGYGREAENVARRAGQLSLAPGISEAVPVEILIDQTFGRIFKTPATAKAFEKAKAALYRIGAQVLTEGGQEAFQTWASNVINQWMVDPEQQQLEDVAENAVIGGVVGGGIQTLVEGGSAVRNGMRGAPDASQPAPQPTPQPQQPAPGKTDRERIEPRLFDDLIPSQDLQQSQQSQQPPAVDPDDAILFASGFTPEQIGEMSPAERRTEADAARAAGVQPAETLAPGAPPPGTAPMAPRRGTRAEKVTVQAEQDLEAVRPTVNAEPSEAQKNAGNYQKAHVRVQGLDISIENPKGSQRRGTDPDTGQPWQSPQLPADYGYIKRSEGKDGDHVDVYIGPAPESDRVFVIDQINLKTGKFDEHKSVLGARDLDEAVALYTGSFDNPTLDRIGDVTEMSVDEFRQWVKDGKATKRPAAKAGIGTVIPAPPPGTAPAAPRPQFAQVDAFRENQRQKATTAFYAYLDTKAPLDQESIAAALQIDANEAGKLLQQAALKGSIYQSSKGKWRRIPTRRKPTDLMEFIASIGGISDPTGELAGMDLPKMTAYGPVVRKTGRHPDDIREQLVESGFLRDAGMDTGGQLQTTVADVYDLLDRHMRGQKVYSQTDGGQQWADEIATQQAVEREQDRIESGWTPKHPIAERWGDETWAKIEAYFSEYGSYEEAWSPQEVNDAARMIAVDGMEADNAFERAAMIHVDELRNDEAFAPEIEAAFQKNRANAMVAFDVPPFPDVETQTDAVQQQGSQEAGDGVRPDGEGRADAGSEAEVRSPAAQVPDAGEGGTEAGGEGQQAPNAVERVAGPDTGELQAEDSDEIVSVTLTAKGPWDFNDTFPLPDAQQVRRLEQEGRNPFEGDEQHLWTVEQVVYTINESIGELMDYVATARDKMLDREAVRKGQKQPPKGMTADEFVKKLSDEIAKANESASDVAGVYADLFGRDAPAAMLRYARQQVLPQVSKSRAEQVEKSPKKTKKDAATPAAEKPKAAKPVKEKPLSKREQQEKAKREAEEKARTERLAKLPSEPAAIRKLWREKVDAFNDMVMTGKPEELDAIRNELADLGDRYYDIQPDKEIERGRGQYNQKIKWAPVDAVRELVESYSPPRGQPVKWYQAGQFSIEIAGQEIGIKTDGEGSLSIHAFKFNQPFPSNSGFRSMVPMGAMVQRTDDILGQGTPTPRAMTVQESAREVIVRYLKGSKHDKGPGPVSQWPMPESIYRDGDHVYRGTEIRLADLPKDIDPEAVRKAYEAFRSEYLSSNKKNKYRGEKHPNNLILAVSADGKVSPLFEYPTSGRMIELRNGYREDGETDFQHMTMAYVEDAAKLDDPSARASSVVTEEGADGKPQLVLEGAEQDVKGALKNAAKAPLKAKKPQQGMDVGMFGDAPNSPDLFDKPAAQPKPTDWKAEGAKAFKAGSKRTVPEGPLKAGAKAVSDWYDGWDKANIAAPVESWTPAEQQAMPSYGSANTLVTADRAAELREKLKAKLKNQVSAGIDPEMLAMGAELAAFHIEAGARRFADFARAIASDLGTNVSQIRPYLRAWYNGARDMIEDAGLDIAGMDSPDEVKAALAALDQEVDNGQQSDGLRPATPGVSPADEPQPVQEPRSERDTGGALQDDRPAGGGDVREPERADADVERPAERVRRKGKGARSDTADSGRDRAARDGAAGPRQSDDVAKELRDLEAERAARRAQNYRITPEDRIGQGGPKEKVAANIEAIRTLKAVMEEKRLATADERKILVRYVGWGAFAQDVFAKHKPEWAKERAALADLLTSEEFASARASTLNAHYTSEAVIKGMWQALDHLGFKGGRALEPSSGVGHFIGLTPDAVHAATEWSAVELDTITGNIAKLLYSGADVNVTGFEKFNRPPGFYDLAISNVPFGDYRITDPKRPGYLIHDYFFIKGLDLVRPGGLVAFITSSGTMDKQDQTARKEIAKRADFVGAIRLPGGRKGAFAGNAGTEVTTDIIFLRRRGPNMAPIPDAPNWLGLKEITTPDGATYINQYFADNPAMMLGEMRLTGTMYRDKSPVLVGDADNMEQKIAAAAAKMPANIMLERSTSPKNVEKNTAVVEADIREKEGGYFLKDGILYRKVQGVGQPQNLGGPDTDKITSLVAIRDVVNELLANQAKGETKNNDTLRQKLNKLYDAFVKKHGPINLENTTTTNRLTRSGDFVVITKRPNFSKFSLDPDAFKVAAIENYNPDNKTASKAAIFTADILGPAPAPQIASSADTIGWSLNMHGRLALPQMASLAGVTEAQLIRDLGDLIYKNPASSEWETRDQYLSGDVVTKLEEARGAVESDPAFRRNVDALEKVQPKPLTRDDIRVPFGAPWVPADVYKAFFRDELDSDVTLTLNPVTKRWGIKSARFSRTAETKYAIPRMPIDQIVKHALDQTPARVMDKTADDKLVLNVEATEQAQVRINALREAFAGSADGAVPGWIWSDDERSIRLEAVYNLRFNRLVPQKFDGSHLTFPGLAATITDSAGQKVPFTLRAHQKNAVARVIQNGNTLFAHVVGAGKTFTMIAAGMEQRRLGQKQRPMFIVPNHMLEQFSREFLQAYPGANILVAQKDEMTRENRKAFAAKIAAQKWDGIIITHDAFGRIRMSQEAYQAFTEAEIEAVIRAKTAAAEEEGKKSPTVKDLEKLEKKLETKLANLIKEERKDEGVTFEELGVDQIYLDEAHLFKNLSFFTRHTRIKGIGGTASQRATDLFMKIRHLEKAYPGRSAVFATGTPVSNTMAEMYTMQRYLQLDTLAEYGVDEFDAWAATFGEVRSQMELGPDGRTLRETTSFSRFINIPELNAMYSRVADAQTADMLNLPRPKRQGGKIEIVEAEFSDREEAAALGIVQRALDLKGKKAEKGADNMLKVVSDGRKLATDARLLNPDMPYNPQGKVAKAIAKIHEIWKAGEYPAIAQVVFLDMGVPQSKKAAAKPAPAEDEDMAEDIDDEAEAALASRFDLYNDIRDRLVSRGIPREQIAFIHEANDDLKKARLFGKVRSGEVRVLLGSTGKMGVGTNVQRLLKALHHLDAPWKPAEVEQRDGRIERQGNLNPEIQIIRYITKKSMDAFMWQTLERKAQFIGQLLAGAKGVRHAEDIDSPLPEAADMKAAATGDPRIMEQAELTKRERELKVAQSSHNRIITEAKRGVGATEARITYLEGQSAAMARDAAKVKPTAGEAFKITLEMRGRQYPLTERKQAGEMLRRFGLDTGRTTWGPARAYDVGTISDLPVQMFLKQSEDGIEYALTVRGEAQYGEPSFQVLTEDADPVGLVRRIENALLNVPAMANFTAAELERARTTLTKLKATAVEKPFPRQKELDETSARLKELNEAFKKESEQKKPPAPGAQLSPPQERLSSAARPTPGLYSGLLKAVEGLKQEKAPAAQWLGTIRNQPGVKAEEMAWIGLEDWLSRQTGTVTKAQIADFVRANQVQVSEVAKGQSVPLRPANIQAAREWAKANLSDREGDVETALEEIDRALDGNYFAVGNLEALGMPENLVQPFRDHIGNDDGPLKFSQYQLPGGENYRELLLTLPAKDDVKPVFVVEEQEDGRGHRVRNSFNDAIIYFNRSRAEAEELAGKLNVGTARSVARTAASNVYRSSHWDEPNVLAHVRFNERTDADGKKVLFIEEIQSDWHQAGKKKGYKRALSKEEGDALVEERRRLLRQNDPRSVVYAESTPAEIAARAARIDEISSRIAASNGVPDAPFKSSWPELAMKRMIRWAAENGFDRIAWTPGDVQAERYDLSKQVDSLLYKKNSDGTYQLSAQIRGRGQMLGEAIKESDLDAHVGKEIAEKIAKGEGKRTEVAGKYDPVSMTSGRDYMTQLSGLDLKVGGEGMKAFYDSELVYTANRLGKKFGAKVGKTSIPGEKANAVTGWESTDARVTDSQPLIAWSLDITPAMRGAAMQGQPLFRLRPNQYRFAISQKQAGQLVSEIGGVAERILGHRLATVDIVRSRQEWLSIFDDNEDAVFDPNTSTIYVALQATQDPRDTLRHEAIHALRQAGVFTPQEWAVLSRMARQRWIDQYQIRQRYESIYSERFDISRGELEELLVEEAIADAFGEHWLKPPQSEDVIARIFARLKRFLDAVANAVRGMGFQTADDVLTAVERGDVAAREPGSGQDRNFLLTARQASRRRLEPPKNAAPGSFEAPHDERVRKALFDSTDTILNRIRRAGKGFGVEFLRLGQDREIDLKRTQSAIERASGPIAEPRDAYLAASLYPGRTAQRDRDLMKDDIEPLIADIAARGLDLKQVDDFVRARHAIERNLEVGQLWPPGHQFHEAMTNPAVKGASGLSEDEATAILDAAEANGTYADLEAVGDRIVALNRRTLTKELNAGLITQETYDALTAKYRYYVPLRGFDEATGDEHPETPKAGSRYDVRGREFQQAFGRSSMSDSPLAYSILQARQEIIRSEKNRVGKAFLRLVQANPNEAFWQVNRRDLKKVIDKNTGLVRNVYDRGTTQAENVFAVKVGGKAYHITLHHPGLLRAMKGIGGENMHGAMVVFHKINRVLAALNTSYDPEFIFRNLIRDTQQAAIVLQEENIKGLARSVIADMPKATAGVNRMLQGDYSTPWARYAKEFADAGGKTGFLDRQDIQQEKANLERLMKEQDPSSARATWMFVRDHVFGRLDRYNDAIENTLRLSTYVNLRRNGVSQDKAALAAKEITVNFNRKGELGPAINSLYLFFNASMQGAANMTVRLLRSSRLRKIASGIVVASFLLDMLNRMIAGDDDDGENRYDKISDEIKARQVIIMMPKGFEDQFGVPYFKWPMPLGYNMFAAIGTQTGHVVAGARSPMEAAGNMLGSIADSFDVLGMGGTMLNLFAPTLLDPLADIATNTDWFGEDIVPRVYDETIPMAERHSPSVTPAFKAVTDFLAYWTGGTPERAGAIDWSPEWVEHVWDFATGGVGRLVSRTMSTIDDIQSDEPWEATKTPFARVFVGQSTRYADRDEYYRIKDAVHVTEKELEARAAEGDTAAAERVRRKYAREVAMIGMLKDVDRRMTKLRKELKAVKKAQGMGEETRKARVDAITAEMDALQLAVRKRWNELGEKAPQ